jgi:predicted nucleic acid-binding protein
VSRIFWDTNLFVYLIEDFSELSDRVVRLWERMLARGDVLLTSTLTLGELLVKPREAGAAEIAMQYEAALTRAAELIPFDVAAARRFGEIRADRTIRRADAIQLACAAEARSDLFITNDDRLSRKNVPGIHFIVALEHAFL